MNTILNIVLTVLLAVFVASIASVAIVADNSYAFSGQSITRSDPSEVSPEMSLNAADNSYALVGAEISGPSIARSDPSEVATGMSLCPVDNSYALAGAEITGPSVSTYSHTADWNFGLSTIGFLPKKC